MRRILGLGVFCGLMLGVAASAVAQAAKTLTYDVVSIKPNKGGDRHSESHSTNDTLRMENYTVKMMIGSAYGMKDFVDGTVEGLPKWAEDERFDVEAKVAPEDVEAFKKLTDEQRNAMLVAALEDRLKLKAHTEVRLGPVYSMVVGKGGAKLKLVTEAAKDETAGEAGGKPLQRGLTNFFQKGHMVHMEFHAIPMDNLAQNLSFEAGRQVNDATGLMGEYDFTLEFVPRGAHDDSDEDGPRIFTALEQQLGLKLVPAKGPVDVVVVEHVEQPTEN